MFTTTFNLDVWHGLLTLNLPSWHFAPRLGIGVTLYWLCHKLHGCIKALNLVVHDLHALYSLNLAFNAKPVSVLSIL